MCRRFQAPVIIRTCEQLQQGCVTGKVIFAPPVLWPWDNIRKIVWSIKQQEKQPHLQLCGVLLASPLDGFSTFPHRKPLEWLGVLPLGPRHDNKVPPRSFIPTWKLKKKILDWKAANGRICMLASCEWVLVLASQERECVREHTHERDETQ